MQYHYHWISNSSTTGWSAGQCAQALLHSRPAGGIQARSQGDGLADVAVSVVWELRAHCALGGDEAEAYTLWLLTTLE